jgi:hypothetical protein
VELDASALKVLGYDVPSDWKWTSNRTARNPLQPNPGLYDTHDKWDTGLAIGVGVLVTAATLGAMGIGPLAGPGGAAAEVAGIDATVGSMGAGGWAADEVIDQVKDEVKDQGKSWLQRMLGDDISPFEAGLLGLRGVTSYFDSRASREERNRAFDEVKRRTDLDEAYRRDVWNAGAPYREAGGRGLVKLSSFMDQPPPAPGAYRNTTTLDGPSNAPYPTATYPAMAASPMTTRSAPSNERAPASTARASSTFASAPPPTGGQITHGSTVPINPATDTPYGHEPVSTTQPVREAYGQGTVRMQLTPTLIKDVPLAFVDTWKARGATVLEA